MAKRPQPQTPKPERRTPRGGAKPKLGARVHAKGKHRDRPVGRPRAEDTATTDPRRTVLRVMRTGLSLNTAMEAAGITQNVVDRWRSEPPDPVTGFDFASELAQARCQPKIKASVHLFEQMAAGNASATMFFLKHRTAEYRDGGEIVPADMARQVREFVEHAQASQDGNPDVEVLKANDQDDEGKEWSDQD